MASFTKSVTCISVENDTLKDFHLFGTRKTFYHKTFFQVSDFNPSSFGDINPSSFNSTPNVPTTSGANQQSAIPGGPGQTNPSAVGVNQQPGQTQNPNNTPALPDLDTSNLDGLDIPTGVDTSGVTPTSQSAMDINNILGKLLKHFRFISGFNVLFI